MCKVCPSSSSSVQAMSKLVHMLCTNWALVWAHMYISKQFPSLGTPSVTAWTQLVHVCEQVSFQVGNSNLYCSAYFPWPLLTSLHKSLNFTKNVQQGGVFIHTRAYLHMYNMACNNIKLCNTKLHNTLHSSLHFHRMGKSL